MASRVLIHVGAPKTGTSFVQDILFLHREALAEQGLLYPADRFDAHFLASLDLLQLPWGGLEREAVGRWDELAAEVRGWPGTAVVSHEILGTASALQARRALASLGAADHPADHPGSAGGTEVHLLLSARDLVRQIPAEWQENVKHRRVATYADFLAQVQDPDRATELARWFWAVQEVPDVLDRWGATVPPERVHLVTVPPPGADRSLLWQRFAGVLGVDAAEFAPTSNRANASLGVPEAAMMRALNERLREVVPNHHYRSYVREMLAHRTFAAHVGSPRLALPPDVWAWAADLSRAWVEQLAARGYDVVGDLGDLLATEPPVPFADPDDPDWQLVAESAVEALGLMTAETARLRDAEVELHAIKDDLMRQIDELHAAPGYRAKERLVRLADSHPVGRAGRALYRRGRGSSSRST